MLFTDLETEKLLLKNISISDAEFMFEQFSNDFINRYLYDYDPLGSIEEAIDLIKFYTIPEPRNQHRWVLILKDGNIRIGTIGYHAWDLEAKRAEIGYDLKEEFNGKGYMNEAFNAALNFGLDRMKIEVLSAVIYVENLPSIRLVEKNGFRPAGTRIETFHGKEYLHHLYQLNLQPK